MSTPVEKAANDIRISMNSRARNVIRYASSIMKEKNLRELQFSAVGGSIGTLLDTVEVLKVMIPGLYQQNTISSVAYQTVDSENKVMNQRLYPKLKIVLSLDEFKTKNEGTQDKMEENLRKDIEKKMEERKEERKNERERGGRRGRGFRGRGRGFGGRGRGGFRGRGRGGFRGRSGFRGRGRGFGGMGRGGFRGRGRGGFRGVNRGRGK